MSYSQHGEDTVVAAIFGDQTGRVLEIGAFAPKALSNSRLFIERGWEAVLIDCSPWAIAGLLEEYGGNSQVTIIQAAVTVVAAPLSLIRLTPDGVSSSDPAVIETWDTRGGYKGWAYCATITPEEISLQFGGFDYISIDIEGGSVPLALRCLELGWEPRVWCVEHDNRLVELQGAFGKRGYKAVYTTTENVVLSR